MFEYAKLILWKVSTQKNHFRNKLISIVNRLDRNELPRLKKYCYAKYYDMYPEVIDEIFVKENITSGMRKRRYSEVHTA